jgi:hypothetical protein
MVNDSTKQKRIRIVSVAMEWTAISGRHCYSRLRKSLESRSTVL